MLYVRVEYDHDQDMEANIQEARRMSEKLGFPVIFTRAGIDVRIRGNESPQQIERRWQDDLVKAASKDMRLC